MKKALLLLALCAISNAAEPFYGYVPNPLRHIRAQWREYKGSQYSKEHKMPLPQEFDLRTLGNGTAPIRNQGNCGSCWWFGTKSQIESLVKLRDARDVEVSGQWGIDCAPQRFAGCGGGDMAFDKFKDPRGSVYESEYPIQYEQSGNTCETAWLAEGHYHEKIVDWALINNGLESMQEAIYQNESPLTVTIGAGGMSSGWQDTCRTSGTNHIVAVVGWVEGSLHGHDAGPYWIVQNSWGTSKGINGYYYIKARGADGTICSSLGDQEVALANYKPACTPQPKADAGPDKNILKAGP